ncbi:hypothetical protein NB725_001569 [Pantoea ananatis]|nr:hypothetical protein [Pantoea ananatis]MCW0331225.1 hypothetical protein [Pantoea ananatis]MCW0339142.1 hypothetical protein [Pantoea ananatis]MCW0348363.1 hypothetical protein [Pantoea ananatis]MCW0357336.1 hypothetical protein [Pantoea ananatis]
MLITLFAKALDPESNANIPHNRAIHIRDHPA